MESNLTNSSRSEPRATVGKILVFRLSSLGDVVLATSVLTRDATQRVDWVVKERFSEVLRGHPQIDRLWVYSEEQSWIALCRQLWEQGYSEVWDAHRTLRTRVAKVAFLGWSLWARRAMPVWRTVSKQRWRTLGLLILKSYTPKRLLPSPWVRRYVGLGGSGSPSPSLRHLLGAPVESAEDYCVAPGSAWRSKEWGAEKFVEVLRRLPGVPCVLGQKGERAPTLLMQALQSEGIPFADGTGLSMASLASRLRSSRFLLSVDTGLAHLAEGLGTRAFVIYGPTAPEMGFGVRLPESGALGRKLGCRPCSKSGQHCFRFWDRYACLKGLDSSEVHRQILTYLSAPPEGPRA